MVLPPFFETYSLHLHRSDRTVLMPWVKFLWESYCQVKPLVAVKDDLVRMMNSNIVILKDCGAESRDEDFSPQCLELLRTNSRVERLYHNIAQQAFKFCLKYQRKTEFRKLCDKLRFIAILSRARWNGVIS